MSLTELERKFDIFRRSSTISKKSVCWTCILRYLRENNFEDLLRFNRGDGVIKFFLNKLMKYDCSDKKILYIILEFCFRFQFYLCVCDDKGQEKEHMVAIMKPLRKLRSSRNTSFSRMDLEAYPMCTINVVLMLVLSKYGIHIGKSVFNIMNATNIVKDFMLCVQAIGGISSRWDIRELSGFAETILNYFMNANSDVIHKGKSYTFLIIRTLEAVKLALCRHTNVFNYIRNLEVFYRTIPDPFVSQEDMKGFLRNLLAIPPFEYDNLDDLAVITEIYPRCFRNIPMHYSPRPLKHLCRISLRYCLSKSYKLLPHSVRKLHIPRDLHDYLLCMEPIDI